MQFEALNQNTNASETEQIKKEQDDIQMYNNEISPGGSRNSTPVSVNEKRPDENTKSQPVKRGVVYEDTDDEEEDSLEKKSRLSNIEVISNKASKSKKLIPWKPLKAKRKRRVHKSKKINKKKDIREKQLEKEIARIFNDGDMFGVHDERWETNEDDPKWWTFPHNDLGSALEPDPSTSEPHQQSYTEANSNPAETMASDSKELPEQFGNNFCNESEDKNIEIVNRAIENEEKPEVKYKPPQTNDNAGDMEESNDCNDISGEEFGDDSDEGGESFVVINEPDENAPYEHTVFNSIKQRQEPGNESIRAKTRPVLVPQDKDGKFVCTICNKRFARKPSVYGHKKAKHAEEFKLERERKDQVIVGEYKCNYCPKHFLRLTSVYAHKQTFHFKEYMKEKEARAQRASSRAGCQDEPFEISNIKQEVNTKPEVEPVTSDVGSVPRDSEGLFYCTVCNKKFQRNTSVYAHRKKVHPDVDFSMAKHQSVAKRSSGSLQGMKQEESTITCNGDAGSVPRDSTGLFYCTVCDKRFTRNTSVYAHRKKFHPEVNFKVSTGNTSVAPKEFQCEYCPRSYSHKGGLSAHKLDEHYPLYMAEMAEREKERNTAIVAKQVAKAQGMKHLINKRLSVKGARYPHRKITLRQGTMLSVLKRDEDHNYLCKFCDRKFLRKTSVLCHMKYSHPLDNQVMKDKLNKSRKYKCPHCDHTFDYRYSIYEHIKKLHPEISKARKEKFMKDADFFCKLCDDRPFTNYQQAYDHARRFHPDLQPRSDYIYQKNGPALCPYCGLTFKFNTGLKAHVDNVHLQKKRYVCFVCGARYNGSTGLKKHELTHLGKDGLRHQCKYCDKRFKDKYRFEQHEMQHRGEYKFYCHACNAGFMQKYKLSDHILIEHSDAGDLPFKCDHCSEGFQKRTQLYKHRKTSHEEIYGHRQKVLDASEPHWQFVGKEENSSDLNLSLRPIVNDTHLDIYDTSLGGYS